MLVFSNLYSDKKLLKQNLEILSIKEIIHGVYNDMIKHHLIV